MTWAGGDNHAGTWEDTVDIGDVDLALEPTAVGMAAARAIETAGENRLVCDPYAAALVVGEPQVDELAQCMSGLADQVPQMAAAHRQMVDYQVARTHFFDRHLDAATASGIRQVVMLASGLDTRAYRLAWPDGTTVFEVERREVLEYKETELAIYGVGSAADRRAVPATLDDNWPRALWRAGFNHNEPTVWLAEGPLPLPPGSFADLFNDIDGLSESGSRLAIEGDARWDPATWLAAHGWQTACTPGRDYLQQLGRAPVDGGDELFALDGVLVTAEKF